MARGPRGDRARRWRPRQTRTPAGRQADRRACPATFVQAAVPHDRRSLGAKRPHRQIQPICRAVDLSSRGRPSRDLPSRGRPSRGRRRRGPSAGRRRPAPGRRQPIRRTRPRRHLLPSDVAQRPPRELRLGPDTQARACGDRRTHAGSHASTPRTKGRTRTPQTRRCPAGPVPRRTSSSRTWPSSTAGAGRWCRALWGRRCPVPDERIRCLTPTARTRRSAPSATGFAARRRTSRRPRQTSYRRCRRTCRCCHQTVCRGLRPSRRRAGSRTGRRSNRATGPRASSGCDRGRPARAPRQPRMSAGAFPAARSRRRGSRTLAGSRGTWAGRLRRPNRGDSPWRDAGRRV